MIYTAEARHSALRLGHLEKEHTETLARLVVSSEQLMTALRCVRTLDLRSWCIGAGIVRNLVWNALHGFGPSSPADVDVVYFDAQAAPETDGELERRLRELVPALDWEVTNQAHVHRWFDAALGRTVPPLGSLDEGISTWPEFATCVGVYMAADESVHVIAPHGLDDLFEMRVRHNPSRASVDDFRERVRSKRFHERWPRLTIYEA
jgi:hypothetical protein